MNYVKANMIDKAVDIYTSLKKFVEAKELIRKHGKNRQGGEQAYLNPQILIKQAEFERDSNNWKEAADLYQQAGKFKEAIEIYGKQENLDQIMEICKNLEKQKNTPEIELCAAYFKKAGHHTFAKQAYLRLGDLKALMKLHVDCQKWDEAQMLAKQNPAMESMINLPYADWLSANDRFDEAQQAYKKANRPDLSLKIIEFLSQNAITEKRFQDAAQYYWMLATESLKLIENPEGKMSKEDQKYLASYQEYQKLAEIYQAYNLVSKYLEDSYRVMAQGELFNESIFNAARFLVNNLAKRSPHGINIVYVYYALATLGFKFKAFKTAREAYEKLQQFKIPRQWVSKIEVEHLKLRSKPYQDADGLGMTCSRCMQPNPLTNAKGDWCVACGHPVVRNFGSFDSVPLVEFIPDGSIPANKVKELIRMDPPTSNAPSGGNRGWNESLGNQEQVLSMNNHDEGIENDLFAQCVLEHTEHQVSPDNYQPVPVNEQVLRMMRSEEVFVQDMSHFSPKCPRRYFKNMVPDVAITMCEHCTRFFIQDEYEFAYMELGHCPFCKHVEKDKGTKQVFASLADMRM